MHPTLLARGRIDCTCSGLSGHSDPRYQRSTEEASLLFRLTHALHMTLYPTCHP
jgi:hypothetical protein